MIPSGITRSPRARAGVPVPVIVAAGLGAVVLALVAWVMLTMNTQPATEVVSADVPVNLN